jgi:Nuclease-related domain
MDGSAHKLRLRYPARCCVCRSELKGGTEAWWDREAKVATCLVCGSGAELASELAGTAGASARQKHERLHEKREQQVKGRWGKGLGSAVLAFSDDPRSTRAWRTGAVGEERLARFFEQELPASVIALHDRRIPGSRANIDHVVVAPNGVWVIDAKLYKGRVERRNIGPIFRREPAVFVHGRDRTKLIRGMPKQVAAVRDAVAADPLADDVVVRSAVCFVASDWSLFAKPFEISGVLVTWPQKLAERIASPGRLTPTAVARIANRIGVGLPPAGR